MVHDSGFLIKKTFVVGLYTELLNSSTHGETRDGDA